MTLGPASYDAFVSKLNWNGSALTLVYSTYLGGDNSTEGYAIAIDSTGAAYVVGETNSTNFPTMNPVQLGFTGDTMGFVTKLNAAGAALVYSTYLGGDGYNVLNCVAVDSSLEAVVAGFTEADDFPVTNWALGSEGSNYAGGGNETVVARLNAAGSSLEYSTYLGGAGDGFP